MGCLFIRSLNPVLVLWPLSRPGKHAKFVSLPSVVGTMETATGQPRVALFSEFIPVAGTSWLWQSHRGKLENFSPIKIFGLLNSFKIVRKPKFSFSHLGSLLGLGLPYLTNKNAGHPVKLEFQINNKWGFYYKYILNSSWYILIQEKLFVIYLKF